MEYAMLMSNEKTEALAGRSDRRLVAQALLGFWLLHLIYRSVLAILNSDPGQMFDPALLVALSFGFAMSVGLCLLLRAVLHRGLAFGLGLTALLSLPISLIYAAFELTMFFQLSPRASEPPATRTLQDGTAVTEQPSGRVVYRKPDGQTMTVMMPPIRQRILARVPQTMAANATGWYFFYFGLGALFVGLANAERLRRAERVATKFERLAQESQLRALRYQINPHFLFNTLNSLSALIMTRRTEEAETMVLNLSAFFRSTLALDPSEDVTLREELVLQRLYLDIEQGRFPERLRFAVEIPPNLLDCLVPALILQPLVENAIKHGVTLSQEPVAVRICASLEQSTLMLLVENDVPAEPPDMQERGIGIGLKNVAERLAARFGTAGTCETSTTEGRLFRVTLRMPAVHG